MQYVARQNGSAADDFRGYLRRVEAGIISKGRKVTILPGGSEATVAEIHVSNDHQASNDVSGVDVAKAGQVIALRFAEDVNVSRGDMIA